MKPFNFKVKEEYYDIVEVDEYKDTVYHAETVKNTCYVTWKCDGKKEKVHFSKKEVIRNLRNGDWILIR